MKIKFDMVNAEKNFSRVMDELGRLPGFDRRKVILAEAGSILKRCAVLTPVAPLNKVDAGARNRILRALGLTGQGDITINSGKRGPYGRVFIRKKSGTRFRRTHEPEFKPLNQHYKNDQWIALQNAVARAKDKVDAGIPSARLAAGLARQSWILIADKLGINLAAVPGRGLSGRDLAEASKARGPKGRLYENGTALEEKKGESYTVTLINRLPYGRRIGLDQTLQAAIAGRVSYVTAAMAKGAFDSFDTALKKFPRWFLKRSS